ncbi:MAG: WD domain protein [Phylliscum demangeonii]|nr:MAG: WD domain protein [Phylliscum demangeonii]
MAGQQLSDAATSGPDARRSPRPQPPPPAPGLTENEPAHYLSANNASSQRVGLTKRLRCRPPPSPDANTAAVPPARPAARHGRHDGSTTDNYSGSQEAEEEQEGEDVIPTPPTHRKVQIRYQEQAIMRDHSRGVSAAKLSPDERWIASASAAATIRIWDGRTGKLAQTLHGHQAGISTITWCLDSQTLASSSDDMSIRGKPYLIPSVGQHNVFSFAFSPEGSLLASGSYDEAVFLWDVRSARLMRLLLAHSDPVGVVDFVHDATLVVNCSSDGLVRIWDTAASRCLRTLVHETRGGVVSVRFGKYGLAWTLGSSARLWSYVYQGVQNEQFSLGDRFVVVQGVDTEIGNNNDGVNDGEDSPRLVSALVVSDTEDGAMNVATKQNRQRFYHALRGVVLAVDQHPRRQVLVTCGERKAVAHAGCGPVMLVTLAWRPLKAGQLRSGWEEDDSGLAHQDKSQHQEQPCHTPPRRSVGYDDYRQAFADAEPPVVRPPSSGSTSFCLPEHIQSSADERVNDGLSLRRHVSHDNATKPVDEVSIAAEEQGAA